MKRQSFDITFTFEDYQPKVVLTEYDTDGYKAIINAVKFISKRYINDKVKTIDIKEL